MEKRIKRAKKQLFIVKENEHGYDRKNYCHKLAIIVLAVLIFTSGCSQKTIDSSDSNKEDNTEMTGQVGGSDTASYEEGAAETQVIEDSQAENLDFADRGSLREWSSIMNFPSEQEIIEFNKESVNRSAYITGWLDIEPEMKFLEYSIDFKADYLPYGTYFGCASIKMDLSSLKQEYDEVKMDGEISFYGGLQMREPEKDSCFIMSFWDIKCTDKEGEASVIHAKLVYPEDSKEKEFHHEGDGVNYLDNYEWKEGRWYRMLFQCGRSEENGHTLVEQWICDLETGEWTKLCCYDTGLTDSCFVGSAALFLENFIESYAGDIRTIECKNIRIRPIDTEQWISIRQIDLSAHEQPGSFCFGADDEQFWMITTGLEDCSLQQCGQANTYNVTFGLSDSPYGK